MTWEIAVPFQDERDRLHLGEIHDLVHEAISDPKEQKVTYELLFDLATTSGIDTYGDLLDRLEKVGEDGRRQLVDQARSSLGMESLADEQAHRVFEAANRSLRLRPARDAEGKIFQSCHAPDCNAMPRDEQGCPVPAADRRWFCDQHKDQAEPGDDLPPDDCQPRFDWATMRLLPSKAEEERLRRQEERRQEEQRKRRELKREQAERMRALEEARFAEMVKELPPGVWSG